MVLRVSGLDVTGKPSASSVTAWRTPLYGGQPGDAVGQGTVTIGDPGICAALSRPGVGQGGVGTGVGVAVGTAVGGAVARAVGARVGLAVGDAVGDGVGLGVVSITWNVRSSTSLALWARSVARIEMVCMPTVGTTRARTKLT